MLLYDFFSPVVCCDSVVLSSTKPDFADYGYYQSNLIGTWTKESNEINDRPIYKKGSLFLAVQTVSSGYIPSWVGGVSEAGSGSGFFFGQSRAPKCPHAVSAWTYYSQNSFSIEEDDSFMVTCGARECPQHNCQWIRISSFQSVVGPSPPPLMGPQ